MNKEPGIEIIIDEKFDEPKIVIYTKERTEQIDSIISAIKEITDEAGSDIVGKRDGMARIIPQKSIIRARTEGRKIVIDTDDGTYSVKNSLSGLEEKLDPEKFIRISQSEVINLYRVKHFDISLAGTVLIEFDNGDQTYVARRFVKSLKKRLNK